MKNLLFLLLFLFISLITINCSNDDNGESYINQKNRINSFTIKDVQYNSENKFILKYNSNGTINSINSTKYPTFNFTYSGDKLEKVNDDYFNYYITYKNNKISNIKVQLIKDLDFLQNLDFIHSNNDNTITMKLEETSSIPAHKYDIVFNYKDGNLIEYIDYGEQIKREYTYDNTANPFQLVPREVFLSRAFKFGVFGGLNWASKNNVKSVNISEKKGDYWNRYYDSSFEHIYDSQNRVTAIIDNDDPLHLLVEYEK